jgi:hypothetical protein
MNAKPKRESPESPESPLLRFLIVALFNFILKKFLGARTQEDRDKYWRGKAKSQAHHPCINIDDEVIYYEGVNCCVKRILSKEIATIGSCKSRQFLKLCETLGFPEQSCNLDYLEKSFINLIDYICHLSNELMTATKESQKFEDAFNRYTRIWYIFDEVNAIHVLVESFQLIKKYAEFEKFKSILRVERYSAEYQFLQVRAFMTEFRPETDHVKLVASLEKILLKFRGIRGIWPNFKVGCLNVMVPVLTSFRMNPLSKDLPANIQEMVAEVVKFMLEFGEEIFNRESALDYKDDLRRYHCSNLPTIKQELPQFLLDKLGN